jgi:hypothetical protein
VTRKNFPGWDTRQWIILAAAIRILASFTRVGWHYPDEWYQTVEFSRLLLGQSATHTHEMSLHLRNLSWPLALCLPLKLASVIAPHWTHLRLIACQLFAGAIDLMSLWAFARLARGFNPLWRHLGFALLILPWFRVQDSVSLGAEHIAVCLIWITLALMDEKRWWAAGILAMGIFSVKYPAGLITAGFSITIFVRAALSGDWKPAIQFFIGLLLGLGLFGAGDWIFYGRPWESVWMYLQFNVFTTSALKAFGAQGPGVYADFFGSRWLHVLFPLGLGMLVTAVLALALDLKKIEPWAWASIFYLLGHLLVTHREARFMVPLEALLLWGALKWCNENQKSGVFGGPRGSLVLKLGLSVVFVANLPLFLKASLAETGTLNSSYFHVDALLRDNPGTCAVISQRMLNSLLLPGEGNQSAKPTFGYFTAERRQPTYPQAETRTLAWYLKFPQCAPSDPVLLLVDHPDVTWVEKGCRLQKSGLLEILPPSLWVAALRRGWVSGPWYVCPSSVLVEFKNQVQEDPFMHNLSRFPSLPPFGINTDQLAEFRDQHSSAPICHWTCM